MKLNIILLAAISCILAAGCDQGPFEDPNLDFSNTYPAYVRFSDDDPLSVTITETDGSSLSIGIEIPPVVYPDTEVSYEITGDWTSNGTATVEAGLVEGEILLEVPANALAPGDSLGESTITLVSATNGVVIGRGENALGEEVDPVSLPLTIMR